MAVGLRVRRGRGTHKPRSPLTHPVRPAPASVHDAATVRMPDPSPRRRRRWPSPGSGIRRNRSRASRRTGMAPASSRCREMPETPASCRQISASGWSRTDQNSRPGMVSAAWHGSTRPDGRDVQRAAPPTAHARLRPPRVIVRHDQVDHQPARVARTDALHLLHRTVDLIARRHQRLTVPQRPAVVLRMGDFHAAGAKRRRQLDQSRRHGRCWHDE